MDTVNSRSRTRLSSMSQTTLGWTWTKMRSQGLLSQLQIPPNTLRHHRESLLRTVKHPQLCGITTCKKVPNYHLHLSIGQTDRTKSQCEEHRDRLQGGLEQGGQLPVGVFVPQCDSDGRYRPLQVGDESQKVDRWPLTQSGTQEVTDSFTVPRLHRSLLVCG